MRIPSRIFNAVWPNVVPSSLSSFCLLLSIIRAFDEVALKMNLVTLFKFFKILTFD